MLASVKIPFFISNLRCTYILDILLQLVSTHELILLFDRLFNFLIFDLRDSLFYLIMLSSTEKQNILDMQTSAGSDVN